MNKLDHCSSRWLGLGLELATSTEVEDFEEEICVDGKNPPQ